MNNEMNCIRAVAGSIGKMDAYQALKDRFEHYEREARRYREQIASAGGIGGRTYEIELEGAVMASRAYEHAMNLVARIDA